MRLEDVRKELKQYWETHPVNAEDLAKKIGISACTFRAFMNGAGIKTITWNKIEAFLENIK